MTIVSDISFLNPKFGRAVRRLHEYLIDSYETGRTKTRFEIFETFRDPKRQADLIKRKVSKAGPWQSAHQFGLAVDLVPYLSPEEAIALGEYIGERVLPGWSWWSGHDYVYLADSARKFGLAAPIKWDPCHIEHPRFESVRDVWRRHFED